MTAKATAKAAKKRPTQLQLAKILPFQLAFSPNVSTGSLLPFATLGLACHLGVAPDLTLKMDIQRPTPTFGMAALPSSATSKGEVVGDLSIARYVARSCGRQDRGERALGGPTDEGKAGVDQWVDYASAVSDPNVSVSVVAAVAATLDSHLAARTYLAGDGNALTLADFAVFAACGWADVAAVKTNHLAAFGEYPNANRWCAMMSGMPCVLEACSILASIDGKTELFPGHMEPLADGCGLLEGGFEGQVCTRFPPEPSGYLHIGHAKVSKILNLASAF